MQTLKDHIIIMPLFFDWNWTADYQRQTAKLLSRNNCVVFYCEYKKIALKDLIFSLKSPGQLSERRRIAHFYFPIDFIPFVRFQVVRKMNGFINACLLFLLLKQSPFSARIILWGFQPGVAEIRKNFPWQHLSLYDCVDYYSSLIPEHKTIIREQERYIKKTFDLMVVNSAILYKLHHQDRQDLAIVPLGFTSPVKITKKVNLSLPNNKPFIGYVGAINYRIDFSLLLNLIKRNQQWQFVLWGPRLKDPQDSLRDIDYYTNLLFSLPNVTHGESHNRDDVYSVIKTFNIAMIPYDSTIFFNKYCYPMKLFEYFYMGKPVIATSINELKNFPLFVKIGKNVSEWEKHIIQLLSRKWPKRYIVEQKKLARKNSWEKKIESISQLILSKETYSKS